MKMVYDFLVKVSDENSDLLCVSPRGIYRVHINVPSNIVDTAL